MKRVNAILPMALLCTSFFATQAFAANNAQTFTVNAAKFKSAPVIDGSLTDEAWDTSAMYNSKAVMDYNAGGGRTQYPAIAYVGWDDKTLYLAYNIANPNASGMEVSATERDGEVWADDEVEIFIDPVRDGSTYYQICVNSDGVILDDQAKDNSWDAVGVKVAAKKDATRWTLEMAIPFSDLGALPKAGTAWSVNFTGHEKTPEDKWISWTTADGFHDPETFGTLKFINAE